MRIYDNLVEKYSNTRDPIEPPGIHSLPALEACIERPKSGLLRRVFFKSLPYKGAVITHGLICSHPFCNGNKRVAFAAACSFFELNGYCLIIANGEVVPFLLKIAQHELDVAKIASYYGQKLISAHEWQNKELDKMPTWIEKDSADIKYRKVKRRYFPPNR